MYEDTPKIVVPSDWNAEKDLDHFDAIHGDPDQRRIPFLLGRIEENCADMEEVVCRAACFLLKNKKGRVDVEGIPLLGFKAKVELVRDLIYRNSTVPEYRARFDENLNNYLIVDQFRTTIMGKYVLNPESVWLNELVDLDDWIVTIWMELDESMTCEHEGFIGYL